MRINLTDNNRSNSFLRKDIATLFPIAEKTIANLCRDNENLLIFPYCIETADDRIGEASIMSIHNTSDSEKVCIETSNVMGFIGIGGLRVKIKSRFDDGRDDYLLHYMLQKVLSFNLFDLSHNNEQEDVFDFIMLMFPYFLKAALRQGVYREYKNHKHNDTNLKGTINIGRHIARNVPFVGNIAYSTREYSYDNNMTELIRHTIEQMKKKKYGQAVLNIDSETIENINTIVDPYYTKYRPLQSLCLQILRMEEVKYGESDDEICGILFDGAWLWEEYVNTILRNIGFIHPQNKLQKGGIYLFDDRSGIRFPDFYKEDMVLDAKYKRLGSYEKVSKVDNNDIHQVITYMNSLHVRKGGFVAPLEQKQNQIPTSRLKDSTSTLSIFGIEISKTSSSYVDFCEQMKGLENVFVESLKMI